MKEQSISKGFAILSLASIISKVISVLYVPLLTRIIGKEGMGIYGQVYEVFVFIYALTNVGIQTAISKYVAELNAEGNYRDSLRTLKMSRTILLILGSFFTLVMMLGAPIIAKLSNNPQMVYGLVFLSPTVMVTSVLVAYKAYFQGRNQVIPIGVATVIEQVVNVGLSLICAYFLMKAGNTTFATKLGPDAGPALGAAGGTVGTSIGALIAVIYFIYIYNIYGVEKEAKVKQNHNIRRVSGETILRKLIKYGLPITLSAGLQNFGNVIDMMTINNRLAIAGFQEPERTVVYGLLSTRYKTLLNVPMIIITSLGFMALPAISKAYVLKNKKEVKTKVSFSLRMVYIVSIPATFGLALLAKEIYIYMFGSSDGYMMMVMGAVALPLMGIVLIQNVILQSVNQFYYVLATLSIGLIAKVGINFFLVAKPEINIFGAVIGTTIASFISMILNHFRMRKTLKFKISMLKLIIKPFIASIYMSAIIIIIKYLISLLIDLSKLNILIGIPIILIIVAVGSLGYLHALLYLGGIRKNDIQDISPKILKFMPRFLRKYL
ncbi:putative polysaccharide biosynthesis protein [Clostridium tarantellae]|uniref:Oligosaccharide flippase family protein n=1 Tax=Clostridium tarantellae TaxID=39493 RepID=A0A6I1MIT1_9CLOT|nr:polysaccharide biosynthesis protein [Clostridium tarantellae]MPQ42824.1 oligosaccharide flippase family protein [Clostridium tarantellae]